MKNVDFDNYMLEYKKRPLKEKQEIIIKQLKLLSTLTNTMCSELDVENEVLLNREVLDVEKSDYTEDDFAEAVIVYINSIQNSLCDFDLKLTEVFEKKLSEDIM